MKLINLLKKTNFKSCVVIFLIIFSSFSTTLSYKSKEVENKLEAIKSGENKLSALENEHGKTVTEVEAEVEAEKKKKKKVNKKTRTVSKLLSTESTLLQKKNFTSLQNSTFVDMNMTYVKENLAEWKNKNRRWDYKMFDKQLEDIFKTMHIGKEYKTIYDDRAYMEIFLNAFYNCDKDQDNVLNYKEFLACMKSDSYLAIVSPPPKIYAARANYTDSNYFYHKVFEVLDTHETGFVNFHAYMELRLMIFSWKKCSVAAPFIEETSWECAIETISGYKSTPRSILRSTFYMCLELANAQGVRNIDFISYLMFASSSRLFGRINGKMDHDITKNEFNLVLDENMLPARYNQQIVNTFFDLTHDLNKKSSGIDFQTFVYYDFALRVFNLPNSTRHWALDESEFVQVLNKPLFPSSVMEEIKLIPSTNFTKVSNFYVISIF